MPVEGFGRRKWDVGDSGRPRASDMAVFANRALRVYRVHDPTISGHVREWFTSEDT